ncbi:response regulator transcription factor [Sulfurospirillum deleyianum]|uniref:Response regulator receiver n=1 Tax=Sulfurospirillum deleyianum (strain ATCC 51133 / DSM 6946 / 5175) TaxID=525898 RepID=D1B1F3_SULD5|nr:response regulator transcription factor [Sulfurospirillum deleyianum]ACZ11923.1 response regulator receiver [Sulfurospirillum deleyianum DSM 6946]
MHPVLTLLLVEDDHSLREELVTFLSDFFDEIEAYDCAEKAYENYQKKSFDLVMTDIELPHQNGLSLVEKIKKQHPSQMVIVISAYKEVDYFLKSIDLGIFCFLTKPFDSQLLINTLFKVTALLKQQKEGEVRPIEKKVILHQDVLFDMEEYTLHVKGIVQELTAKEEKLLFILVKHRNHFVRNEQLSEEIWGMEDVNSSTLRALVKRVRDKLGYEDSIVNLKNRGYKLNVVTI